MWVGFNMMLLPRACCNRVCKMCVTAVAWMVHAVQGHGSDSKSWAAWQQTLHPSCWEGWAGPGCQQVAVSAVSQPRAVPAPWGAPAGLGAPTALAGAEVTPHGGG